MTFKPKREPLFQIKKGDPIQVIKQTNIGTQHTDVFYFLRRHNGKTYAQTKQEISKQPVFKPDNSTFSGWTANSGIASGLFNLSNTLLNRFRLPNSVVEEQSVVEKVKEEVKLDGEKKSKLTKLVLVVLGGFLVYRLIKKQN